MRGASLDPRRHEIGRNRSSLERAKNEPDEPGAWGMNSHRRDVGEGVPGSVLPNRSDFVRFGRPGRPVIRLGESCL